MESGQEVQYWWLANHFLIVIHIQQGGLLLMAIQLVAVC